MKFPFQKGKKGKDQNGKENQKSEKMQQGGNAIDKSDNPKKKKNMGKKAALDKKV